MQLTLIKWTNEFVDQPNPTELVLTISKHVTQHAYLATSRINTVP